MTDLITRLEQAEAGSRELDLEIFKTACPEKWQTCVKIGERIFAEKAGMKALGRVKTSTGPEREAMRYCPFFTTSLDAITALIGEKLPGWTWGTVSDGLAFIKGHYHAHPVAIQAKGKTVSLALCIALLRAIEDGEHG